MFFFIAMQHFFYRDKSFRPSRIKKWHFRRGRDRPFGVTEKISAERGDNVCIIRQSLPYTDRINVRAWRFCLTESWNPLVWNRKQKEQSPALCQQAKSQISVSQLHFWGTTNHKTSPYYIYNYLIIKYIIYKRRRL